MLEVDVNIPSHLKAESIPKIVEQACARFGLDRCSRGTLAKYPGCVHWHYKKGRQRGTLEITWWSRAARLWIKVAAGRSADWITESIPHLKRALEEYDKPAARIDV